MAVSWENNYRHHGSEPSSSHHTPAATSRPVHQRQRLSKRNAAYDNIGTPSQIGVATSPARPTTAALAAEYQREIEPMPQAYPSETDGARRQPSLSVRHCRSAEFERKPRTSNCSSLERGGNMTDPSQLGSNTTSRPMRKHKSGSLRVALRRIFSRNMEPPSPFPEQTPVATELPTWYTHSEGNLVDAQETARPKTMSNSQTSVPPIPIIRRKSSAGRYNSLPSIISPAAPTTHFTPRSYRPGLSEHPLDQPSPPIPSSADQPRNAPIFESSPERDSFELPIQYSEDDSTYNQDKARKLMGIQPGSAPSYLAPKPLKHPTPAPSTSVPSITDDATNLTSGLTAPRRTMELTSLLARLSELEERMGRVESAQRAIALQEHRRTTVLESHGRASDQSYNSGPYHTPPASQHNSPQQPQSWLHRPSSSSTTDSSPAHRGPAPPSPALTASGQSPKPLPVLPNPVLPYQYASPPHPPRQNMTSISAAAATPANPQLHYFLSTLASEKMARENLARDVLLLRREVDLLRSAAPASVGPQTQQPHQRPYLAPALHLRTSSEPHATYRPVTSTAARTPVPLAQPRPLRRAAGSIAAGFSGDSLPATTAGARQWEWEWDVFAPAQEQQGLASRFSVSSAGEDDEDVSAPAPGPAVAPATEGAATVAGRTRALLA